MTTVAIVGSGMVTALGYNSFATLAALRAGVSGVEVTPWMDFGTGEPLRGACVALPQWGIGIDKLADLAACAICECLQQAGDVPWGEIPILVGISHPDRPHRPKQLEEDLLDAIGDRLDTSLHAASALFPFDEVGCVHALLVADRLLSQKKVTFVVVAGVDSFLHQATLDHYRKRRRVMTSDNSNGFFPGEAGTAVLLGKAGVHATDELHILGIGVAREEAAIDDTKPLRAKGLTEAIKDALRGAGVAFKDVGWRITDLTGEHYKFKESAFAIGRLDTGPRDGPPALWHPSEYVGAIGAAVLPCLLAQAMHAMQNDYAPGPLVLCHVGSDDGARGAIVVTLRRGGVSPAWAVRENSP